MTELHKAAFQQSLLHLLSQTQVCCSARAVNSECAMHQNYRYFERKLLDHSNYLEKWKKNLSDTFYFIALKKKKKNPLTKQRWHSCVLAQVVLPSSIHPLTAGYQGKSDSEPPFAGDPLPGQDPTGNARATGVQL